MCGMKRMWTGECEDTEYRTKEMRRWVGCRDKNRKLRRWGDMTVDSRTKFSNSPAAAAATAGFRDVEETKNERVWCIIIHVVRPLSYTAVEFTRRTSYWNSYRLQCDNSTCTTVRASQWTNWSRSTISNVRGVIIIITMLTISVFALHLVKTRTLCVYL